MHLFIGARSTAAPSLILGSVGQSLELIPPRLWAQSLLGLLTEEPNDPQGSLPTQTIP